MIAAGLAALALAYLYAGRQYPLDSLAAPGPGVFPLASGLALLVLATCQAIVDVAGRRRSTGRVGAVAPKSAAAEQRAAGYRSPYQRRAPLFMAVLLAVYAASLPVLGFLPASCLLVVLATKLMGVEGWWRPTLLAAGVAIAVHVIFIAWLGVPLPAGVLR